VPKAATNPIKKSEKKKKETLNKRDGTQHMYNLQKRN
jgi:hypothetical protein